MNINLLAGARALALPEISTESLNPAAHGSFADAIGAAISQVEKAQASAKDAATDFLSGGKGDIHNVALASQRAELSLELFQQVRNKFVQAYQEVMKMPM